MKKLSTVFLIFSALFVGTKVFAMGFSEALEQTKPVAVLIYADWADNAQNVLQAFQTQSQSYGDKYNFVTLNIANKETKDFNAKYHIYPNLPYVLLFKNKGRINRYLQKDCVLDKSCFTEKLNFFNN